jgi:hypothetical protein
MTQLQQSLLKERPTIMSMRVRIAAVAFAFAMMPAAVGCSIIAPHAGPSKNPSASSSTASTVAQSSSNSSLPGRWTADALAQAFTAINQKIGANPADYVEVVLNGLTVAAKAINPRKRQNVDEYAYDGTGVKVTPVDVSHNEPGAIEESAFKSDYGQTGSFGQCDGLGGQGLRLRRRQNHCGDRDEGICQRS